MELPPLISIVVPVYKVEEYLERCINSLINQTFHNIEIILIDDGSPDNCPIICDNYSAKDSRVVVIHKENGGLSDARNCGLRTARGEYILFVDSDDYIERDACERFVDIINENRVDIVVANLKRIEDGRTILMMQKKIVNNVVYEGKVFIKLQVINDCMYVVACSNLYKKNFLLNNSLFFKVGILYEDEQWTPRVFLKAQSVIYMNYSFYKYIIRPNSITTHKSKEHNISIAKDMISICYELYEIYEKLDDVMLRRVLEDTLCAKYLNVFQITNLRKSGQKELIIKKFVFKTPYFFRTRLKAYLFCINTSLYFYTNKFSKFFIGILVSHKLGSGE